MFKRQRNIVKNLRASSNTTCFFTLPKNNSTCKLWIITTSNFKASQSMNNYDLAARDLLGDDGFVEMRDEDNILHKVLALREPIRFRRYSTIKTMSERPMHVTALKRRLHALVATPIHAIASHHNDLRAKYILTCEILYDGKDFVQQHEITAATPDSTPGAAKHIPRVRTRGRTPPRHVLRRRRGAGAHMYPSPRRHPPTYG